MKTIDEQIAEHEAAIAELKKQRDAKPKRVSGWRPKKRERYYFVNDGGSYKYSTWMNDEIDLWRLFQNNVFRTEADTINYRKICQRSQELIEQGERIDWENAAQDKFYFWYNHNVKGLLGSTNIAIQTQGTTYFLKPEFEKIKAEFDEDTIMLFVGLR